MKGRTYGNMITVQCIFNYHNYSLSHIYFYVHYYFLYWLHILIDIDRYAFTRVIWSPTHVQARPSILNLYLRIIKQSSVLMTMGLGMRCMINWYLINQRPYFFVAGVSLMNCILITYVLTTYVFFFIIDSISRRLYFDPILFLINININNSRGMESQVRH